MIDFFKKSAAYAFGITSAIFAFVPEKVFNVVRWIPAQAMQKSIVERGISDIDVDIVITRLLCFVVIWCSAALFYGGYIILRRSVKIKGTNYTILVKYGNLLNEKKCKKVINFDECYTTQIGQNPWDVKPESLCGQYLREEGKNINIQQLIEKSQIRPEKSVSRFQNKTRFKPGSIIANNEELLMAFATLDENGKAKFFTQDEYVECLETMWKQIEINSAQQNVCVPILGSGLTKFEGGNGASLSQQELLDLMIWSYKLSPHKVKAPYSLRIICKKRKGFSLNNIDGI